jgi:hypothetical protein
VYQKESPHKTLAKVKKTREEMQTTLENKKKVIIDSSRNALKRKNKVEGKTLGSLVKKEHENINLRA